MISSAQKLCRKYDLQINANIRVRMKRKALKRSMTKHFYINVKYFISPVDFRFGITDFQADLSEFI